MNSNKEIDILEANLKITEHFQVPEGYFESFSEMMANKLSNQPFQPMKLMIHRESPIMRVAAVVSTVFILALSGYTLLNNNSGGNTQIEQVATHHVSNESYGDEAYSIDEAAEYAMIDLQDIHELISE